MFNRDLQSGSFSFPGGDVWNLQLGLQELGYGSFTPTGFFGEKTKAAIINFQKDNNITPSVGYFGPITRPIFETKLKNEKGNRNQIFNTAKENLGIDVTPEDIIPDEYDCADTICVILEKAGFSIGNIPLTTNIFTHLNQDKGWIRATSPLPGDVILSPTSWGNGKLANGHVGIVGENGGIISNSSYTGLFNYNYTIQTWRDRYQTYGGFPILFFRKG